MPLCSMGIPMVPVDSSQCKHRPVHDRSSPNGTIAKSSTTVETGLNLANSAIKDPDGHTGP